MIEPVRRANEEDDIEGKDMEDGGVEVPEGQQAAVVEAVETVPAPHPDGADVEGEQGTEVEGHD